MRYNLLFFIISCIALAAALAALNLGFYVSEVGLCVVFVLSTRYLQITDVAIALGQDQPAAPALGIVAGILLALAGLVVEVML